MAIRNIVNEKEDILKKKSRDVENFDLKLHILLDDMIETMKKADGIGLAAVQVGILRKVIVINEDNENDNIIELINPVIIETSGEQESVEGCLSCPGNYGITKRPMRVIVKAKDRFGKEFIKAGEGLLAKAFCHEIDHLNGILFYDHVIRPYEPEKEEE